MLPVYHLVRGFYHECIWIFSNAFSTYFEMILWFYFSFVNVVYCIDSHMSKHPCRLEWIPLDHGICHSFYGLLDLVANILLRISASIFTRYWPLSFLLVGSLSSFDIRMMWALKMSSGSVPSFSKFWKSLRENQCKFFFGRIW